MNYLERSPARGQSAVNIQYEDNAREVLPKMIYFQDNILKYFGPGGHKVGKNRGDYCRGSFSFTF